MWKDVGFFLNLQHNQLDSNKTASSFVRKGRRYILRMSWYLSVQAIFSLLFTDLIGLSLICFVLNKRVFRTF